MLKMKKLLLLSMLLGFLSYAEEPADSHSGDVKPGSPATHSVVPDLGDRNKRLADFVNACTSAGAAGDAIDDKAVAPAPKPDEQKRDAKKPDGKTSTTTTTPPKQTADAGGSAVFQSKCLGCHGSSQGTATAGFKGMKASVLIAALDKPGAQKMPKNGSLTAAEKASLTKWLNEKGTL